MKRLPTLAVCSLLCALGSAPVVAQDRAPAPDNTRVNKQNAPTADQATNAKTDRELMQQIRKSLVDDKSLSTYGHNVKVIASHGKVTLKGPVNSEEEKRAVEKKAEEIAGAENVTSDITIKAARSKK